MPWCRTGGKSVVSVLTLGLAACVADRGLAGCGQSDDRESVRSTTERFLAAVADDEGATACGVLKPGHAEGAREEEASRARRHRARTRISGGAVTHDKVISRARRSTSERRERVPQRCDAGWRIAAVGCEPPRSDGLPFDCEVEA